MNSQRLRNLTTGILHTEMSDIYEDLAYLTGKSGVMTHQLPNAMRGLTPWLKEKIKDSRYWNGEFDQTHNEEIDLVPMSDEERKAFFERFAALPSPLDCLYFVFSRFFNK